MADSFSVVTQLRSVRVIGPTQVVDVELVGFVTHPTEIYAEYPVPLDLWRAGNVAELLGPIAHEIESLIANTAAVTGSYSQDVDENGLLVDYIDFVVSYQPSSGLGLPQTATVSISIDLLGAVSDPIAARFLTSPDAMIQEAYDRLVATASL